MWCCPTFQLDAEGPECKRRDIDGADGAFVLSGVLSRDEAARMVAMAELMGFEEGEGATVGRTSAAVSWCLHDELAEQLIRRVATLVPWGVAVHGPGTSAPSPDRLPQIDGVAPWVRCVGGVPEGLYTLDSLNCRARIYRYAGSSSDRFRPHHDECWPGSRLRADSGGGWSLDQDRWQYSSAATAGDPNGDKWSWRPGERVSHLTVLLYLNDDFEGGETVLFPGAREGEALVDGSVQLAVKPVAGAMLCFGQSFKFNRERVEHSFDAILHEGLPVSAAAATSADASAPRAGTKYVLRTDVCYTMPRR